MGDLSIAKCVPCEGNVPRMLPNEIAEYQKQISPEWKVLDNIKLQREFHFKNFKESMEFVNKVAKIAESEQHHPDIYIFYSVVKIELWTHVISGLFKNDFIMASKIDKLVAS